ncbi:peptidyl-prolyl cis-trans isomerase [uncultured Sphingomonas sp.]|uniref:SurA N-terminal domain-containing protein n=1 Tax=uncultured Sphingomonas sp. TaxID=158754 RepID=UPI0025F82D12|nr:peptidyl-prolyl cis-trans isomerase [uncultured Sphingomonas sp.]
MKKGVTATLLVGGMLALAGCNRGGSAPEGQVAATVNGQEVTLQEVNTEIQSANLPAGSDKKAAQRLALQRVIDRKLLITQAEDKGVDKTPDYLAQKRRAEEMMLAQAYARQQLSAVPVPSDTEINKFMANRPSAFAQREQLSLDQIRFAPPQDLKALQALDNDHSLDAVAAHLTQLGIRFQRAPTGLDTGAVPPEMMTAISKLPAGEPFVVPSQGLITVNVITGRKPVTIDASQSRSAAVQAWRQQKFSDLLQQQLTSLRSSAKITYQEGLAPPAGGPKPAGQQ